MTRLCVACPPIIGGRWPLCGERIVYMTHYMSDHQPGNDTDYRDSRAGT